MATTVSLNSLDTVWVTTYCGGEGLGTCFDISIQTGSEMQLTATFTVADLVELLSLEGRARGLAKPVFQNRDAKVTEDR